jgi:hypothetical protein
LAIRNVFDPPEDGKMDYIKYYGNISYYVLKLRTPSGMIDAAQAAACGALVQKDGTIA